MKQKWQALIPPEKHEAVAKALRGAFSTTSVEDIVPLTGGATSALVYRIEVNRRPYVMRIIQTVHALNDPMRQYACMNIAAEADIAPRVYYAEPEDAVAITDFIASVPLRGAFPSTEALLVRVADAIKAIQETPEFPTLVDYLDGIDQFIAGVQALGVLPESATREHFQHYAEIQRVYPRHEPDLVSSHNDMNPGNLLFDGQKLWVIDWEIAFRNDRYVDLANAANFFITGEGVAAALQEEVLLRAYFGEALNEYHRARFFLMRQVCFMFYAMGLLHLAAEGRTPGQVLDDGMETPRLRDFYARFAAGGNPLTAEGGQLLYAKVQLNEALHHMRTPRFAEAIRVVAG